MVRISRFMLGVAIVVAASGSFPAFSAGDDDPKPSKKEAKKIEMPKLPEGSNPKWDFEAVQEKFTLIKGGKDENEYVAFLVELKEDMAAIPGFDVFLIDKDGVKIHKTFTSCKHIEGKKGDRVWLSINGNPASKKDAWVKAVKVQFVAR